MVFILKNLTSDTFFSFRPVEAYVLPEEQPAPYPQPNPEPEPEPDRQPGPKPEGSLQDSCKELTQPS